MLASLGADTRAQPSVAQGPTYDPAWAQPTTAPSCLPYRTGAIQHAVHVGVGAIAITRALDPLAPSGYDGNDTVSTVELRRTSDLGLIWSRVLEGPPTTLAATADGRRVVIGGYGIVRSIDVASGDTEWRLEGGAQALAFDGSGVLAVSRGTSVDLVDVHGAVQRSIAISGLAPGVVYATGHDGTCDEISTDDPARAVALAFASEGTLVAAISDGSVRALGADDTRRWTPPATGHSWMPPTVAVRLEALERGRIRATYADARVVVLRAPAMRRVSSAAGDCSDAELALARRRLGAAAVGEPPNCAYVVSTDRDARGRELVLGPITRVRDASGSASLIAPTLRDTAGLLVRDEAWLFGIDGTGERWTPSDAGGRFAGELPIPGRRGWVLDVSPDGRWVAVGSRPAAPHGSEDEDGYELQVIDTRTETVLGGLSGTSSSHARFFAGGARIAVTRVHGHHRSVEILEVPSGARVRQIALADAEYGGLVAVDARRAVVIEGSHLRVVDLASGAERAIDLADGVVEVASAVVGERLAMRLYDRTTPDLSDYRIDVVDLGAPTLRVLATTAGIGRPDVQLVDDGAAVLYVDATGVARRLDVASGAVSAAGVPFAPVVGVASTRGGLLYARSESGARPLHLGATPTGTALLDWMRATDLPGASLVYELGGDVYVVGHDGHVRAMLSAADGGLVVRTVSGAFSVTPEARAAMLVREGDVLRPCDASMEPAHVPGLLEALLAP